MNPARRQGVVSERVVCPVCRRNVAAYIPRGGDGTALRPRTHLDQSRRKCEGRFYLVDRMEAAPR